jgi:predicted DNA-binding transcriptional regulator AlpA
MYMDVKKLEREMRLLAEARVDTIAGENAILLTKKAASQICGKSTTWIDTMIAMGRLPTVRVGKVDWVQRPVLIEALVNGM